MLAFVGVRGVVSLAAALAIPLTIATGAPFPDRDLILFVTFGVIVVTLVGQGLLLPPWCAGSACRATPPTNASASTRPSLPRGRRRSNVAHDRLKQFVADGRASPDTLEILRARHDYRVGPRCRDTIRGSGVHRHGIAHGADRRPSANTSIGCCRRARSPTKRAAASSANSTSKRRGWPAGTVMKSRRCRNPPSRGFRCVYCRPTQPGDLQCASERS